MYKSKNINYRIGSSFENFIVKFLRQNRMVAYKIPRGAAGGQPFDVLAFNGNVVLCLDCKVCSNKQFGVDRIESNQWYNFEHILDVTNGESTLCGFVIADQRLVEDKYVFDIDRVYFLNFEDAKAKVSMPSIRFEKLYVPFRDLICNER